MDYKTLLSVLSILIQIAGFLIYFWGIYKGKTKPHAFTWLVWAILSAIGFFAVLTSQGYTVAWVLGINIIGNCITSYIGFYQKRVIYDFYDWMALLGALVGIVLWQITHIPLYAVILISLSDILGMVPTIRKAYVLPFEENIESFAIGIMFYVLAISALTSFDITNWLYPVVIIFTDLLLVFIIFIRRKKLKAIF
jgi:hypothetical protein